MNQDNKHDKKPSLLQMIASVCAAMFGVQRGKNRERDFQHGSPLFFALLGIAGATVFVLVMTFIVKVIMKHAPV